MSRVSLTSWGGASLALAGHASSDGVTIKIPYTYGVDVLLHRLALHPSLPIWLIKTKSNFIVRSVMTGFREMNAGGSCD